ncbi:MAG: DUF2971 domain-containing protein [Acinetobacter sp.]|jgi:hypothetical protein|uniref:DUF2971 domain-containing protein n=1 Tax=Acinetobacter sp. TaxID=472 RepID=UPI00282BCBA4|nr:DUF2971 domain-containing protein [Acinetobacter sp.]MDR2061681.1 DUF2971 domain-containing protein [Acinetobacter sp.]
MNIEEKKKLLELALNKGNYPEVLYKYRTVEQLKKILENNSFWFASPDSFNDPFDCSLSEVESYDLDDARAYFRSLRIKEDIIEQTIEMFQKNPSKLYDCVNKVKKTTLNNKGILALSSCNDDILMWSHYADNHKGIAIGLEVRKDLEFFLMPINIDYRDTYEALNYLKNSQQAIDDTLKLKSSAWSYEKEVRIYKDGNGLYTIKPKAIKEICFGVKASNEDIDNIKKICAQKGFEDIFFYKARKIHAQFGIKFEAI